MSETVAIAGVIFDMDGCLVDTESIYKIAWRKAFDSFAVDISAKQIDGWVGLGWDLIAKQIDQLTQNSKLTAAIRQARETYFFQMLSDDLVHLMPGALEILTVAKRKQLVIGLASSTLTEKGRKILTHFDLLDFFDFLVFGDEVKERKPAGDIYVKAIEKSGLKKEQLLVFEDSLIGCQAANEADLQTVWVPDKLAHSQTEEYPETICKVVASLDKGKEYLQSHVKA